jgi:4-amino-4-deoxy-L-arabinose transferase-like glycosyltransferase
VSDDADRDIVRATLDSPASHPARSFLTALAIIAAFCAAVIPTLSWLEFSSSMENLNVATVLEMRRGEGSFSNWLLPTLEGEPRTAKPPLTAWVTSLFVPCRTLVAIDNADPTVRARAYERLALQVRLSAVAASALLLLGTWFFARQIAPDDPPLAWIAVAVAASSLYLLRFGRYATTDVQLALWVTIADACLAAAVLRGTTWRNMLGAGIALGLALMSKGPVALLQTLLPAVVFVAWRLPRSKVSIPKLTAAMVLMLLIGGAWYAVVLVRSPDVWSQWLRETTRVGATDNNSANPFSYLTLFVYMMPWVVFFVIGLIEAAVSGIRHRRNDGATLALLLVAVPVVVMSFFPDRKERYLLPLLAPAATLAALGVRQAMARRDLTWTWIIQWILLGALVIGLPIAGMSGALKTISGRPWFDLSMTIGAILVCLVILAVGFLIERRRRGIGMILATLAVMLLLQAVFMRGYRDSREGRSEMQPLAKLVREKYPSAEMYNWRRDGRRKRLSVDLSIYLNRPTIWTPDPTTIPPSSRAQVVVTTQNADEPEPQAPVGWTLLNKVPRDKDWYWAFVREPSPPATRDQ